MTPYTSGSIDIRSITKPSSNRKGERACRLLRTDNKPSPLLILKMYLTFWGQLTKSCPPYITQSLMGVKKILCRFNPQNNRKNFLPQNGTKLFPEKGQNGLDILVGLGVGEGAVLGP